MTIKWNELFNKAKQPSMNDVANYVGNFKPIWIDLLLYFEMYYKCQPKMTYSGCSIPGWNLKFKKNTVSFGTWYPRTDGFDVFFTWNHKLDQGMMMLASTLTPSLRGCINKANDFMKNGRYTMIEIINKEDVNDFKKMCNLKKSTSGE